jgi:hypothetical protein
MVIFFDNKFISESTNDVERDEVIANYCMRYGYNQAQIFDRSNRLMADIKEDKVTWIAEPQEIVNYFISGIDGTVICNRLSFKNCRRIIYPVAEQ